MIYLKGENTFMEKDQFLNWLEKLQNLLKGMISSLLKTK